MSETEEPVTKKKRGRGPGKRPALFGTSIRLPIEVTDYFDRHFGRKKQAAMREVLSDYVNYMKSKEPNNGTQSTVNE